MTPLESRLTEEVESLRHQLGAVTLENKLLREKVDLLIRRIFGRSSEQLDDDQLMLLLQGGDDGAKKDPASSASPGVLEAEIEKRGKDTAKIKPRKQREARVPEHLPAVDEVIEPDEALLILKLGAPSAKKSPNSSTISPRGSSAAASSVGSM